MAGGLSQNALQHRAIAQMQVPIIGAAYGDALCHAKPLKDAPGIFQWQNAATWHEKHLWLPETLPIFQPKRRFVPAFPDACETPVRASCA
jgi:hypothetical protein